MIPTNNFKYNWNYCSNNKQNEDTYFQTKESIEALYFARPDVTVKFVFAVCFGTGIFTTTPSANIFAPNTLFTWKTCTEKINEQVEDGISSRKWISNMKIYKP